MILGPDLKTVFRNIQATGLILFFFLLPGCAHYSSLESLYSDSASMAGSLERPAERDLALKAGQICHPLLKPLHINFSDGVSPDEAALIAVIANPSLKAERDRKKIARAQLIQAGILPNPQLSYSLEFPTAGVTHDTFTAYGFGLDWEITSLVTRHSRLSAAKSNQTALDLEIAWKEWQTAEAARLHWLRLYWNLEKKKLLEGWSRAIEKRVAVLKEAVRQGIETAPTLASAKTALLEVKARIAKNSEKIQQEKAALKLVMGEPPGYDLVVQKLDFKVPLTDRLLKQIDNASKTWMEHRLDIMALRAACRSRDQQVREAVLSQFPRISIGILHARDTGNVITTGPSVSIEIPLFDRGQGRLATAKALRIQAIDEYRARIFEARSTVEEIREQIRCMTIYHSRVSEAAAAREAMLDIYRKALASGTADVLTYYQALGALLQQKIDLLDIRKGITELIVALEVETGAHISLSGKMPQGKDNIESFTKKPDNSNDHKA